MGVVKKQGFWLTVFSYLGLVVGYLNTAWLFPEFLGKEKFGLVQVVLAFSLIFSRVSLLGTPSIIIKFFPHFKNKSQKDHGFTFLTLIIPLVGFALTYFVFLGFKELVIEWFSDKSPLFVEYLYLAFPISFLMVYYEVLTSYSISLFKPMVPNFIRDVLLRVLILTLILLYIANVISFKAFLELYIVIYGIINFVLLIYLLWLKKLFITPRKSILLINKVKEIVVYGLYIFLNGVSNIIRERLDLIMIGAMIGLEGVGIYALAFYLATIINIPALSISKILLPFLSSYLKDGNLEKVEEIYQKTAINQLLISGVFYVLLIINLENGFRILPEYRDGFWVVVLIGLAKLTNVSTGCNGNIIVNSKYYRFSFISSLVLAVLMIICNLVFIPLYGIEGAAGATFISVLLYNVFNVIFLWIVYKMNPFNFNTMKGVFILLFSMIVGYYLPELENVYIDVLYRSGIVFTLFFSLVYFLKPSDDINELVDKKSRQFLSKL